MLVSPRHTTAYADACVVVEQCGIQKILVEIIIFDLSIAFDKVVVVVATVESVVSVVVCSISLTVVVLADVVSGHVYTSHGQPSGQPDLHV